MGGVERTVRINVCFSVRTAAQLGTGCVYSLTQKQVLTGLHCRDVSLKSTALRAASTLGYIVCAVFSSKAVYFDLDILQHSKASV